MADFDYYSDLHLHSGKVKGASAATAADEYVTLGQAEGLFRGINKYFTVEARSTGNVDVASAPASVDGKALAAGDAVLLDQQTTATEDGLWIWAGTSTPLTRHPDFPTGSAAEGVAVTVIAGDTHGPNKLFIQTVEDAVVGTNGLSFTQVGSGGPAGGAGMTSGFDVQAADTSVTVGADDIAVNLNTTGGLETSSGVCVKMPANPGLVRDATGVYVDPDYGISVGAGGVGINRSVVPSKYATATHASSTSITINHALNTEAVSVTVRLAGGNKSVIGVAWDITDADNIVLKPNAAPSANAWHITVEG